MKSKTPGEQAAYYAACGQSQNLILDDIHKSFAIPSGMLKMNDMWSRIKRVNDWHAKAIVTGDFSDAPLADIACVSNFARERLRDIEDMSDQELRLRVNRNPVGWDGIQKGGSA